MRRSPASGSTGTSRRGCRTSRAAASSGSCARAAFSSMANRPSRRSTPPPAKRLRSLGRCRGNSRPSRRICRSIFYSRMTTSSSSTSRPTCRLIPATGTRGGTLVNALLHHCAGSLSGIGGVVRPGIVHRLDMDTTGCLVAAKERRGAPRLGCAVQGARGGQAISRDRLRPLGQRRGRDRRANRAAPGAPQVDVGAARRQPQRPHRLARVRAPGQLHAR